MQTSLNDHQQLLRGLHQNQTLGKLEFVIIQRAVIKTIPSVFSVFVLSQCYMPVLEINALTDWLIRHSCLPLIRLWLNRAMSVLTFDVYEQTLQRSRTMYNSWVKCRETCKHHWTIYNNYLENCIRIRLLVRHNS